MEKIKTESYWTRARHIKKIANKILFVQADANNSSPDSTINTISISNDNCGFTNFNNNNNDSKFLNNSEYKTRELDIDFDKCDNNSYYNKVNVSDVETFNEVNDNEHTLFEQLCNWAVSFDITNIAITGLLKLLKNYHDELPLDARTLLHTPQKSSVVALKSGGEYLHLGVQYGIEDLFRKGELMQCSKLELQFSIDGLPLFKSSSSCLWPILCNVRQSEQKKPFVVCVYSGNSKPVNLTDYFEQFILDCKKLVSHGLLIAGVHYEIALHSFVCDALARAMIKRIKSHSGYFGCDKCRVEGEWNGKVTFQELNAPLRTDDQFDKQADEDHHLGLSPLSSIPIGMVSGFPLDYMHLVCRGVVRRLLLCWLKGPKSVRCSAQQITLLSSLLIGYAAHMPIEFARKPRSVSEIMRWKATELRQFLFYTGPVVLRDILPENLYENFLYLSVAISILASPKYCRQYLDYAKQLLIVCVENMKVLYGTGMLVYNVHGLIHLADDVKNFGPLDNFSAFPFENKLRTLKKLVRKPSFILKQIERRLSERQNIKEVLLPLKKKNCIPQKEHNIGPVPFGVSCLKQYCKLSLPSGLVLSTSLGNDCFLKLNGQPCLIRNILSVEQFKYKVIVDLFRYSQDFYISPLPSSNFNVLHVSNPCGFYETINIDDILQKCVCLPYGNNSYVAIPFIHTIC